MHALEGRDNKITISSSDVAYGRQLNIKQNDLKALKISCNLGKGERTRNGAIKAIYKHQLQLNDWIAQINVISS